MFALIFIKYYFITFKTNHQRYLNRKIRSALRGKWRVWIGLYAQFEGVWRFENGEIATNLMTPWLPNEPNNNGGNQHCAAWTSHGGLDDAECYNRYNVLCQIPGGKC